MVMILCIVRTCLLSDSDWVSVTRNSTPKTGPFLIDFSGLAQDGPLSPGAPSVDPVCPAARGIACFALFFLCWPSSNALGPVTHTLDPSVSFLNSFPLALFPLLPL